MVLQQRLPFPVQIEVPAGESGAEASPEIQSEILLELMSTVTARLARMEAAETSPGKRAEFTKVRKALLAKRFEFDPHDAAQVGALMREFSSHAVTLASAEASASTPAHA